MEEVEMVVDVMLQENVRKNGANGGAFVGVDQLPTKGMTQAGRTGDPETLIMVLVEVED